mmetsp:Transcript_2717/g.9136  ORF Transcript_2717/g.9136 Transcript_2717/m.9136 type:complete len:346 (+) Transcript_2717:452-1489(+)
MRGRAGRRSADRRAREGRFGPATASGRWAGWGFYSLRVWSGRHGASAADAGERATEQRVRHVALAADVRKELKRHRRGGQGGAGGGAWRGGDGRRRSGSGSHRRYRVWCEVQCRQSDRGGRGRRGCHNGIHLGRELVRVLPVHPLDILEHGDRLPPQVRVRDGGPEQQQRRSGRRALPQQPQPAEQRLDVGRRAAGPPPVQERGRQRLFCRAVGREQREDGQPRAAGARGGGEGGSKHHCACEEDDGLHVGELAEQGRLKVEDPLDSAQKRPLLAAERLGVELERVEGGSRGSRGRVDGKLGRGKRGGRARLQVVQLQPRLLLMQQQGMGCRRGRLLLGQNPLRH